MMKIEDIMLIEIEGITNTIIDYTRDNFILSYAKKLHNLSYPNDKYLINKITEKLIGWYEESIKEIEINQFVGNINEHYKCIEILREIHRLTLK